MIQNDYIINLLNLQDKDIVVDNIQCGEVITIFIHKNKAELVCCNACGSVNIAINCYVPRTIKYLKIAGFKSIIKYRQKRYICKDCKKTFNEECALVNKGSTISNQVKTEILNSQRKKKNNCDIAQELNISHTTVFNEFISHISEFRCKLSDVICVDEFKADTIEGQYALIIGNPISGKILDILPSRKQDYIYSYFQTISKEERLSVKYVVTDLFESYRTICKNLFWNSTHIADRLISES